MIINKKYLAQYCPLPINYDYSEILNYVPVAQEIWIKPILGDAFMDLLEYEVKNNQVSEENSTLFTEGGLYQYLAYATCLEGLPFIWAHISEVGLTKGKSEQSESIDLKDITYIESHLRRQVEFLKDNLIKYLRTHCDSFPLYHPTGCGCDGCSTGGKLHAPKPLWTVYGTRKRCTTLL